jgi:predicted nucleic acid-binding Zn ribbon protein
LLNDPNVAPEDKNKIRELLKKPWNPYIRRHSALTEKSTILREHTLRQHAGWSTRSNMHYFGNESSESLLEAYGIVTRDQRQSEVLKYKQCPNCSEPNKPDSKFCAKCRMVLTYDAYNETLEKEHEKDSEIKTLRETYQKGMDALHKEMEPLMALKNTLIKEGLLKESSQVP